MDDNRITNYMDDKLVDAFAHAVTIRELRRLRNAIYQALEDGAQPDIPEDWIEDATIAAVGLPWSWPHDDAADLITAWRES